VSILTNTATLHRHVLIHCSRYDTGTISGILAMPYWLQEFSTTADGKLTASQDSLIVSILSAGTFFGALTAAPFGDFFGRRIGLMASAGIVFNVGVIMQTAATRQPLFIAGRFFAGYGVGLVSALSELQCDCVSVSCCTNQTSSYVPV
jgi:MFS transporter, SP family, sugar:H+ symporter